jgi:HTH-type transcriptional regulator / antitoxin HigA
MVRKVAPFLNIGPGDFLKEELEARNWKQEDFADILGMSLKSVNKLIKNKQSITIETAKLLSSAFGQSPQYWTNLNSNYRIRLKDETAKEKNVETKATIFRYMPVKEMMKKGWIKRSRKSENLVDQVKRFWGIDEVDFSFLDSVRLPTFRKSEAFSNYNNSYSLTWFEMAKKCSTIYKLHNYNKARLEKLANTLAQYTNEDNGIESFLKDLNMAGVKFFLLTHLQKTYIDGASFFDRDNPVIAYTRRYDRVDNFWFTLAHEIGHILLHFKRKDDYFIDNLDEIVTQQDREADKFANEILKATQILECFSKYTQYISQNRVENCSRLFDLNPGIVVGVLQHYGKLSRRNLNRFKRSVSEFIPVEYWAEKNLEKLQQVQ